MMKSSKIYSRKGDIDVKRLKYLDGLRGLMSINVIICHFICVYYPEMYTLAWAEKYGGVQD